LLLSTATAPPELYTLSLHDALPIYSRFTPDGSRSPSRVGLVGGTDPSHRALPASRHTRRAHQRAELHQSLVVRPGRGAGPRQELDRKSTRLNSSHDQISYAVFCLKK